MEDVCELVCLDTHGDRNLQAQTPTVNIRLHLVSLLGKIEVRLRGHEECR
jgi:hypothetical protein